MGVIDQKRVNDGFASLEAGVDSGRSPALLPANQLAWAVNTTVRGGYATSRPGFRKIPITFDNETVQTNFETGRFQGASGYISNSGRSYACASINGRIFAINLNSPFTVRDISISGDLNSPNQLTAFFQQAEYWMVIQDAQSKPILWDGSVSRRATADEVPVGGPMAYGKGRLWVASGNQYVGGNLVNSESGYGVGNVIRFTENTYIAEGGAFAVPSSGSVGITGLAFGSNLDTTLGDGDMLVFTKNDVFAFDAPVDRDTWKDLQYPIQRYAMIDYGSYSHGSIVRVNGDVMFRSQDGIRSIAYARRDFTTSWGNSPISCEVTRAIKYDSEQLLFACSAVNFGNRLMMTVGPQFTNSGIKHAGLVVMDYDLLTNIREKQPPAWEGVWTGLNFLHVFKVRVSGVERCYAFALSSLNKIELWEITEDRDFDNNGEEDQPVEWVLETRSMAFGSMFDGKTLEGADLWWDSMRGNIDITAKYRADQNPCWKDWATATDCATYKVCATGLECHVPANYRAQTRNRIALPKPPDEADTLNGTLARFGGEFQARLEISGKLRLLKGRLFCTSSPDSLYGTSITTTCTTAAVQACQTGCQEQACCPPQDYSYDVCEPPSISGTFFETASKDTTYSSTVTVGGTGVTVSVTSGSLPPGLSLSGGTIHGTATDAGVGNTYEFTITATNGCGSASLSGSIYVQDSAPSDFIWGYANQWTLPPGPDSYQAVANGLDYRGFAYYPANACAFAGFTWIGTVDHSNRLGDWEVQYQGYEVDGITPVGSPVSYSLRCKAKVWYGEWDGALPSEFTASQITGITNVRTTLIETARNVELSFPATDSAKYRVIAVPATLAGLYSSPFNSDKLMNRIRYADNSDATVVPGPNPVVGTDVAAYSGYPYSDNEILFGDTPSEPYLIYVIDSTASAFTVYLRYLDTVVQAVSNGPANNGWTYNTTVNQFDTADGTLLSVAVLSAGQWHGSSWIENLEGVAKSNVTRTVTTNFTFNYGASATHAGSTVHAPASVNLGAYDGVPDYAGASADKSTPQSRTTGSLSDTYTSGASFTQFQGAGTIAIQIVTAKAFAQSGLASYNHLEVDSGSSAVPDQATGTTQVTYTFHAA